MFYFLHRFNINLNPVSFGPQDINGILIQKWLITWFERFTNNIPNNTTNRLLVSKITTNMSNECIKISTLCAEHAQTVYPD